MRTGSAMWLIGIVTCLTLWVLPGCREQPEEAESGPEPAAEVEVPKDEHAGAEALETAGDDEVAPEEGLAEISETIEIDPDRRYSTPDFERMRAVLYSGRPEQKKRAARLLARLLVESHVEDTRENAAATLGVAPESAVEELTEAAVSDPSGVVRLRAVEALQEVPPSPKLLAALRQIQEAEDPEVRVAALMTEIELQLKDRETEPSPEWLASVLSRTRDDASAQLQIRLVLQGERALPPLTKVLAEAEDPHARQAAACAIALICAGTSPQQQEFAKLSQAIVKETLPKPHPANLDGLKPLENALANDPDFRVRAIAAQGLGYLGQESSAPFLAEALRDSNEEVRWWAALALETVPAKAALGELSEAATGDESERVRAAAVRALGWIDDEKAALPLMRATLDSSSRVRQAAATELGRFHTPASLAALVQLFNDPTVDVRWAAVLAVGELRDREAVPDLQRAMRDPSPMVANAAERALQRMGIAERRFGTREEL